MTVRERWNQPLFAKLRASRESPASYRRYEALFRLLSWDDLKRAREWNVFTCFCEALVLDVNSIEVEMLDPPWPDLKSEIFGSFHYFELAEAVQQDWIQAIKRREKNLIIASPIPLTEVWSPLESIIQKKKRKKYAPEATPLSLLIYFERNAPEWFLIERIVWERKDEIQQGLENSGFDHLWLFMANDKRVIFKFSKKILVAR